MSLASYIIRTLFEDAATLDTTIYNWLTTEYPDSMFIDLIDREATFRGISERINGTQPLENGEDAIYSYCDVYSSEFAQMVLTKLSELVAIPAEELERQWKSALSEDVRVVKN